MRVSTAFNRLLRLPGAVVIDVSFGAQGVIVTVRLRRRRRVCSGCGQVGGRVHARRVERWRHLDLGSTRCVIECELRRLDCPDCGVRCEAVPWARLGSSYTRYFEDVAAWLAQQMATTPIPDCYASPGTPSGGSSSASSSSSTTVASTARRDRRRRDLLSPRPALPDDGRRHHSGAIVVLTGPQRRDAARVLQRARRGKHSIRAVSIDMSGGYAKAIGENTHAEICFDSFHVVRLAQRAVDEVRRDEWNAHERAHTKTGR